MGKDITRRDFLKGSVAGALGLAAGSLFGGLSVAAEETASYTPGTYTASAMGLESEVTVTMTFDETSITACEIDASGETPELGGAAAATLAQAIVKGQTSEVDTVSGASITSKAVKEAAANCIAQAQGIAVSAQTEEADTETASEDWLGEEPVIDDADVYAELNADVVIVGLGLAGVAAARRAGELGASVIGIEKSAAPNCRSGEFAVINSPKLTELWPERAFTQEEVDEIVDSHMNESSYRVKRSIMKKWADNIGEAFDWWIESDPDLFIADETRQAI